MQQIHWMLFVIRKCKEFAAAFIIIKRHFRIDVFDEIELYAYTCVHERVQYTNIYIQRIRLLSYWLFRFHSENCSESIIVLETNTWTKAHKWLAYHNTNLNLTYVEFAFVETAMGVSVDALSKPNSEYVKAVKE